MTGIVESLDESRAATAIRERELVVVTLDPIGPDILTLIFGRLFHGISYSGLTTFTRQLSTMITTGLTVNDTLTILRSQSSPALAEVVDDVQRQVEGGSSLADSMEKHPRVFNRVYVALVRAGEAAGVLDKVLARLADNMEKQREFRAKVKGAMIYPAIIVCGMIGVSAIMMVFVIPKLLGMYQEFDAELPTVTKILINISNFAVAFWWLVLAGLVGAVWFFNNFRRTEFGRRRVDEVMLHLPIIGNLQVQIIFTEMTRTLGLLISAGISIVEALNIAAEGAGNTIYSDKLNAAAKQVEKGLSLAALWREDEDFPPIVPQMVSVGEETGKMDEVLTKLSNYFEQESEQMVKGLTTAIEPIIMVILGIGVGFLIFAVILPIYNLMNKF